MEIPAGFGQLTFLFNSVSVPNGAAFTLGFEPEVPLPPLNYANEAAIAFNSTLSSTLNSDLDGPGVLCKLGPTATGPSDMSTVAIGGTSTVACLPPNATLLVRKITALGGRAGRGRMYIPSFAEATVGQDGVIQPSVVLALQETWDDFYAALVANGINPVLLHGPGSPVTTPTPITSFAVDPKIATQRRRLRR